MAIAFDTSISYHSLVNGTTHTWNHTVTGSNTILWVHVMNSSAIAISSVKYKTVAMTQAVANGASQRSSLFYLVNPATGTNQVEVIIASSSYCYANSASYTGASQTGVPDATATQNAASPTTTTLTTIADNSWAVLGVRDASSGVTAASTNATSREADAGFAQLYDSNGPKTPAGSFSMTVTSAGSIGTAMASFAPAGGSSPFRNGLTMMGVG